MKPERLEHLGDERHRLAEPLRNDARLDPHLHYKPAIGVTQQYRPQMAKRHSLREQRQECVGVSCHAFVTGEEPLDDRFAGATAEDVLEEYETPTDPLLVQIDQCLGNVDHIAWAVSMMPCESVVQRRMERPDDPDHIVMIAPVAHHLGVVAHPLL